MIKLLSANLYRLFHSMLFYIICFLLPVYNVFAFLMNQDIYHADEVIPLRENSILFNHLTFIGFVAALVAGLIIGDEFDTGALRNKLTSGHTRNRIYLSYFITVVIGMLVIHLFTVLVSVITECFMFDMTSLGIREFLICLVYSIVPIACLSAGVLMCICLSQKKATGTVISFAFAIIISIPAGELGWYVYAAPKLMAQGAMTQKQLDTYLVLERVLPDGFSNQLINDIGYLNRGYFTALPFPAYCVLLMTAFLAVGMFFFEDIDLK